jgi:hypothetical protein
MLNHVFLPAVTLGRSRWLASADPPAVLEVMRQDYIRTARQGSGRGRGDAAPQSEERRHPVITIRAPVRHPARRGCRHRDGLLLAGHRAAGDQVDQRRDYPIVQASVLLVAMAFVVVNFLVDLTYGWPTHSSVRLSELLTVAPPASSAVRRSGRAQLHAAPCPAVVWLCATVLVVMGLTALLAPFVAPRDPTDQSLLLRLKPPIWLEAGGLHAGHRRGRPRHPEPNDLRCAGLASVASRRSDRLHPGHGAGMLAGYLGAVDEIIMLISDAQRFRSSCRSRSSRCSGPMRRLDTLLIMIVGINGWMTYARSVMGSC